MQLLKQLRIEKEMTRDVLVNVAKTALRTKLHQKLADHLTEVKSDWLAALQWMLTASLSVHCGRGAVHSWKGRGADRLAHGRDNGNAAPDGSGHDAGQRSGARPRRQTSGHAKGAQQRPHSHLQCLAGIRENVPSPPLSFVLSVCSLVSVRAFREVNSGFFYKSAAEREKLLRAERQFIDERVQKIIDLKKNVCDAETAKDGKQRGFVIINQKV